MRLVDLCRLDRRREDLLMLVNRTWFYPAEVHAALPVGLKHLDSDLCWCDPLVEMDDLGREIVIHRQVSWN